MKHTPGPWHWQKMRTQQALQDASGSCFAGVVMPMPMNKNYHLNHDEYEANARLIAAAPELLDALNILPARPAEYDSEGQRVLRLTQDEWRGIMDVIRKAEEGK